MNGLCTKCYESNVVGQPDMEITGNFLCVTCYEKRPPKKLKLYEKMISKIPKAEPATIELAMMKLKGGSP